MTARFATVDDLLTDARSRLDRLSPSDCVAALAEGARLVDIRPDAQRRAEGEVPGSVIIERNHLEWRLHPLSDARIAAANPGQRWVVLCSQGYTSSLAADALQGLGVPATDVVGGYQAWQRAGLPTVAGGTAVHAVVPSSR